MRCTFFFLFFFCTYGTLYCLMLMNA
uniref:Uncharacterized protein n=1 Tax=Anguilla anguilla TaxID=7936 RepID=A0A0E9QG83_ANGAN